MGIAAQRCNGVRVLGCNGMERGARSMGWIEYFGLCPPERLGSDFHFIRKDCSVGRGLRN